MTHIIKKRHVRLDDRPAVREDGARVELVHEGGIVRAIRVQCSCGEMTVVELEYDQVLEESP